ncbi:MAG: hypothetical protein V4750_18960, partial [Pseudomonadota bacterium]
MLRPASACGGRRDAEWTPGAHSVRVFELPRPRQELAAMMVLYSGTTDPYSHRCRFVLFEKGMD